MLKRWLACALTLALGCGGETVVDEGQGGSGSTTSSTNGTTTSTGGQGGMTSMPCDAPSVVFLPNCTRTGCHNGNDQVAQLDLESADVASRVVGASGPCGIPLAVPSDPDASFIVRKLDGTHGCGSTMPLGAAQLSDADIECVRDWIAAQ